MFISFYFDQQLYLISVTQALATYVEYKIRPAGHIRVHAARGPSLNGISSRTHLARGPKKSLLLELLVIMNPFSECIIFNKNKANYVILMNILTLVMDRDRQLHRLQLILRVGWWYPDTRTRRVSSMIYVATGPFRASNHTHRMCAQFAFLPPLIIYLPVATITNWSSPTYRYDNYNNYHFYSSFDH